MSAEVWNKLKHLQTENAYLREQLDTLKDRVLALEVGQATYEEQADELEPVRRRGRPRKVSHE